ncbi:MAG: hydantoinase/oxoprolinase family protein [Planctomycetes bacterium]|nr:hydantoinase/oxoprolinase family protein [Planctomycetota bacterium]
MSYRVGIDVGGTFTDLFLSTDKGETVTEKVLSTPEDPSLGVIAGIEALAERMGESLKEFASKVRVIVHGTTVTTNATLTRKGAKVGLITTKGVRDALEMRRGIREEQYNNRYENVVPLVPRYLRRTVDERLDFSGRVLTPLNENDVRDAALIFKNEGVTSVAICFLHSYASGDHERKAAEIVRASMPDAFLSVSSECLPAIRFYERISTTVLGAFVGPILEKYIRSLSKKLAEAGFEGILLIMQSSGGVALPEVIIQKPASTLLSGPAGGPRAAATFARNQGAESCIVVDMGGTSFDASLVQNGVAQVANSSLIDRHRISLPMLDITTIGAGGGSIGWIDEGGLLRMGPASAGANPGPACYGRGGELPTCTDANVVLGYLDPKNFAGGKIVLAAGAARKAIETHVAKPLGMNAEEAAIGMYRVIGSNMAFGVREITVRRGIDPREFPMVVGGGASAIHTCAIAAELDIREIIIPRAASVLCALGMLESDLQHDFVASFVTRLDDADRAKLKSLIERLRFEGSEQLKLEGAHEREQEHNLYFDLRYIKQYHEVTVQVPMDDVLSGNFDAASKLFHETHNRLFGYDLEGEGTPLELINVRVRSVGRVEKPTLPRIESGGTDASGAQTSERSAYIPESREFRSVPVFDYRKLKSGNHIVGPALIERKDTTIFVSAAYDVKIDTLGTSLVHRRL